MESYFNLRELESYLETGINQDSHFTGNNFMGNVITDTFSNTYQATFINPPTTLEQQVLPLSYHLITKEYVDNATINGGKNFYLNYSVPDPVYSLFSELSGTIIEISQQSITSPSLSTNLLAQFITLPLNITRIPGGLFTLNQFGLRTGSTGSIQYYFEIYKYPNTLLATSGLSNNVSASVDLFSMILNLNDTVMLTTDRLILKLYSVGIGSGSSTLTSYFEGEYYSFLTTTLNRSSDLLGTNNVWSGNNYYENPTDTKQIINTQSIPAFSMTTTSNAWSNTNNFQTKTANNNSQSIATTAYCDNPVFTVLSSNNTWIDKLFTNETNQSSQLATTKYVTAQATSNFIVSNATNTLTGINIFPSPTDNSTQPANTSYVNTMFSTKKSTFLSQNNTFLTTYWNKASPGTTNISTTSYMVGQFVKTNLGSTISVPSITTSSTRLANSSSTKSILANKISAFLLANQSFDNNNWVTAVSTSNDTTIATCAFVQNMNPLYDILSSTNAWTSANTFLTPISTSNDTTIATTQFVDGLTYTMNNNNITGIHTVLAPDGLDPLQVSTLDFAIATTLPIINTLMTKNNSWEQDTFFPTASLGTNTQQIATCEFSANTFATLFTANNSWTNVNNFITPSVSTNTSQIATTAFVNQNFTAPNFSSNLQNLSNVITGIWSMNNYSFMNDASLKIATTTDVVNRLNAYFSTNATYNFTATQTCPTQSTVDTLISNTAYVASKISQFFNLTSFNTFINASNVWAGNNYFNYALSDLDNSTLGATTSYMANQFAGSKTYTVGQRFNTQLSVGGTYPVSAGSLGYTQSYTYSTAQTYPTGFTTLINFGTIPIGNYLIVLKIAVIGNGASTPNILNFFWNSTAGTNQDFSAFTGSNLYSNSTLITTYALSKNGEFNFSRCFTMPFVNASPLYLLMRATGTLTNITSIKAWVTITNIL